MKISCVIITLNEEKDLTRCLVSVSDWVDEIILVDSGSTDKTVQIAKNYGAHVFVRQFDNYANQKNFADEKVTGDWILSLDADEEIPRELALEIQERLKDSNCSGYLIPRRNIIFGKEIKYTRWAPDKHVWLFKKEKGRWNRVVHEEVLVAGKVGELKNAKIHYSHPTVSEFFKMLNSYTELEAEWKIKNKQDFSLFKMFLDSFKSFIGRYFYKLGFLDGWRGFVLSYLMAIYRMATWIKVWEMGRR